MAAALRALHAQLGIPESYGQDRGLSLQPEATQLVGVGLDISNREQKLSANTAVAWEALRTAAAADGVVLQLVSGFRSIEYQTSILRRKLLKGIPIHEILRSSAAPGYSEHHTGRAIDVTTPGSDPLEEQFERTPAYTWLLREAVKFGFSMSYPPGNLHGVVSEPWHWLHSGCGITASMNTQRKDSATDDTATEAISNRG
ncbi:MAG: D-alanyl-D-alanine carboxypeptidase family protein [Pedosphaera sp.]|nr:D-alanyl-D-alanine carboxypeptidase family protein [Pedosphaera sp.]